MSNESNAPDLTAAEAHANALRDALVKSRDLLCEDGDWLPGTSRAHECITAALIAHPAASLAAYRKSVLEEAQERVVAALREYQEALTRNESFLCAVAVAESKDRAIRALGAQEVKP